VSESNRAHNVAVRPATEEDLAAIASIQTASPEASQWEPLSYLEHECTVAIAEGRVAGFLVSRETAPGEREILNLAVDPAWRRRGVARKLLESELSRPKTQWFLEVRESNAAPRRFYESLGFRLAGRRENYYQTLSDGSPEGAIVMTFFS
jgi:ribosomal-protein-alanine N-acetyltransferase